MKRSSKHKSAPRGPSMFSYRRGTFGCDATFEIVFEPTGEAIACLNYWAQEAETKRDTELLILALDTMYRRGGYFFLDGMEMFNEYLDPCGITARSMLPNQKDDEV